MIMKEFVLEPKGFKKVARYTAGRIFIITPFVLCVLLAVFGDKSGDSTSSYSWLLLLLLSGTLLFTTYRQVTRLKRSYSSFRLIIGQHDIISEQDGQQKMIRVKEISQVIRTSEGGFIIRGQEGSIVVPPQVERIPELESFLGGISIIEQQTEKTLPEKLILPLSLVPLAMIFLVYASGNPTVVTIAGTGLVLLLAWVFLRIQFSNAGKRTRRLSYLLLITLTCIAGIVLFKLGVIS
jgi:hypothetical protein